jgi:hypothetical protein
VRGMGLANLLTDDSARRRAVLRRWAAILDSASYAVASAREVAESPRPPVPGGSVRPHP